MLLIQLQGCRPRISLDIFGNKLQMKVYKIKTKLKNLQTMGAGGDEKHDFSFTRPHIDVSV